MSQPSPLQKRIEKSLAMLHEHQAETARVHETYLKGQETYAQSVVNLVKQYQSANGGPAPASPAPTHIVKAPSAPSNGHGNGHGLSNGNGHVAAKPAPATPAPVAPAPVQPKAATAPVVPAAAPVAQTPVAEPVTAVPAAVPTSNVNVEELAQAMLVVVSEKTGYPVEMLELSMDMESDLGIDSIKRVEILGAMQEQHPELPEVNPNELAELRTLQQIVDHLSASIAPSAIAVAAAPATPAPIAEPVTAVPATAPSSNVNVEELAQAMLVVVSEKTGYPVEMLELSMDMESDLGIDSIKRVEILGAMQEQHPELPEVNPSMN